MKKTILILAIISFGCFNIKAQQHRPIVVGEMRKVMWQGQLEAVIYPDTIADKRGLYGMGPTAFLKGELLMMDGLLYGSKVVNRKQMKVEQLEHTGAPFFTYDHITDWASISIPDSITSLAKLEQFLDQRFSSIDHPFFFKAEGVVDDAEIHIVNLPEGKVVKSPSDAHQGQVNYRINNREVTLIGFFSRHHQAIFTHHDTYLHVHLITKEKDMMGHLESFSFSGKKMKLLFPKKLF